MAYKFYKSIRGFIIVAGLVILFGNQAQSQIITTIAGNGFGAGSPNDGTSTGDGGQATAAEFDGPWGVAVDDSGNVYVCDSWSSRIRKISALTGIINTIAGGGTSGLGDGGPATAAQLDLPQDLALDDSGNVYFADLLNQRIRKITVATGIITTVAGNGTEGFNNTDGIAATDANLYLPYTVAVDDSGNIYIADTYNNRIRKVTKITGIITTVVGNGNAGYAGDNGAATAAELNQPFGVALDDSANIYIAERNNNVIRKVEKKTGIITTIAGNFIAGAGYSGDNGPATAAQINAALDIAVDSSGNVYISDQYNNRIREVSAGIITTFAGNGTPGFKGDGGLANSDTAEIYYTEGVAVDKCGNVYIGDYYNQRIRKVALSDTISASAELSTICSGSSDTLRVSGASTFKWSPSAGLSDTTGSTVVANPDSTTTYIVTGYTSCFGSTTPKMVVVTVNPAPPLTISSQPPSSICSGQSDTLTVSGGGTNYTWTPSSGLNDTTTSIVIANPTATTSYTVTSIGSGGCVSTGTYTVIVNTAPSLTIEPLDTSFCNGQSTTLQVSSGGSNFIWSPSTGLSADTGSFVVAGPTVTTNYIVTGINSDGCADTGTDLVIIIPSPNKPTFTQVVDTLMSSSIYDNQWYRNDTLLISDTSQKLTITIPGEYWVVVNNEANGCSTSSDSAYVKLTGINQLSAISNQLSIYPNPFTNELFIKINSSAGDISDWSLQITDVLGRTLFTKSSLDYTNEIDLSNLSGGVYFITVINKTGRAVMPVVKQ